MIRLAQKTETGIYFVHTTAKEGVAAIAEARGAQLPVYGEALHNYLQFTCDDYLEPDGLAIHTYPAIKFSDDRDALQQGLVDGPICTTATDEWTTYKNIKLAGDTIRTLCGGHNGIETRMPVTYTKLAANGAHRPGTVRRDHLDQRRQDPRDVPAEGRHRGGQRRRHRPLRPQPEEDHHR